MAGDAGGAGGPSRMGAAGGLRTRLTRGRHHDEWLLIERALYKRVGGASRAGGRGRRLGYLNV